MPRPTKLTNQVHQTIVARIRRGLHPERAAQAAGVSLKTFRRWMERGQAANRGVYRDLYEAVFRAESAAEIEVTLRVRKGAMKNPMTSLKLLERRFPERWSPYAKLASDVTGGAAHGIVVVTAEQLRAMLDGVAGPSTAVPAQRPALATGGEPSGADKGEAS